METIKRIQSDPSVKKFIYTIPYVRPLSTSLIEKIPHAIETKEISNSESIEPLFGDGCFELEHVLLLPGSELNRAKNYIPEYQFFYTNVSPHGKDCFPREKIGKPDDIDDCLIPAEEVFIANDDKSLVYQILVHSAPRFRRIILEEILKLFAMRLSYIELYKNISAVIPIWHEGYNTLSLHSLYSILQQFRLRVSKASLPAFDEHRYILEDLFCYHDGVDVLWTMPTTNNACYQEFLKYNFFVMGSFGVQKVIDLNPLYSKLTELIIATTKTNPFITNLESHPNMNNIYNQCVFFWINTFLNARKLGFTVLGKPLDNIIHENRPDIGLILGSAIAEGYFVSRLMPQSLHHLCDKMKIIMPPIFPETKPILDGVYNRSLFSHIFPSEEICVQNVVTSLVSMPYNLEYMQMSIHPLFIPPVKAVQTELFVTNMHHDSPKFTTVDSNGIRKQHDLTITYWTNLWVAIMRCHESQFDRYLIPLLFQVQRLLMHGVNPNMVIMVEKDKPKIFLLDIIILKISACEIVHPLLLTVLDEILKAGAIITNPPAKMVYLPGYNIMETLCQRGEMSDIILHMVLKSFITYGIPSIKTLYRSLLHCIYNDKLLSTKVIVQRLKCLGVSLDLCCDIVTNWGKTSEEKYPYTCFPLMMGIISGDTKMVKFLLESGASPNGPVREGFMARPLFLACNRTDNIFKTLIEWFTQCKNILSHEGFLFNEMYLNCEGDYNGHLLSKIVQCGTRRNIEYLIGERIINPNDTVFFSEEGIPIKEFSNLHAYGQHLTTSENIDDQNLGEMMCNYFKEMNGMNE